MTGKGRSDAGVGSTGARASGVASPPAQGDEGCQATAIGVDVGASRLKLGLVDERGALLSSVVLPTPRDGTGPEVLDQIAAAIVAFREGTLASQAAPRGIGIVVPHHIEGPQWVQRRANNMPALEGLALRPLLVERLGGGELAMGNDVSAAVIAEHMFGRGRGLDRLLLMAIGTGISIGVIAGGELLQYNWGTAGDTGQIIVDTAGLPECSCGARGCLEAVASGTGIKEEVVRAVRRGERTLLAARLERDGGITAEEVAEAARHGDAVSLRTFERAAFFLGAALATYVHLFRPQLIVLAGGVTRSSDLLLDSVRESLQRIASASHLSALEGVELSAFPHMGAAIGSASLILFPGRYLRNPLPMEGQAV
jgi:glucokinase